MGGSSPLNWTINSSHLIIHLTINHHHLHLMGGSSPLSWTINPSHLIIHLTINHHHHHLIGGSSPLSWTINSLAFLASISVPAINHIIKSHNNLIRNQVWRVCLGHITVSLAKSSFLGCWGRRSGEERDKEEWCDLILSPQNEASNHKIHPLRAYTINHNTIIFMEK